MDNIQRAHIDINTLLPSNDARYFSPEDIDAAINWAVTDLFNQQYKVFGETLRISDELSRFKATSPIALTNGIGPMPLNHLYTLNVYGTILGVTPVAKRIRIISEQFIIQYIDSEAFSPDENNAVARLLSGNIQVYPVTFTEINMAFLRKPNVCKYAYTLTGIYRNVPVYDPINSIPIDYSDGSYNQIIEKALLYLGTAQKDQVLMTQQNVFKQQNTPEAR